MSDLQEMELNQYILNDRNEFTFKCELDIDRPNPVIRPTKESGYEKYRDVCILIIQLLNAGWTMSVQSKSKVNGSFGNSFISSHDIDIFDLLGKVKKVKGYNTSLELVATDGYFSMDIADVEAIGFMSVATRAKQFDTLSSCRIILQRRGDGRFDLEVVTFDPKLTQGIFDIQFNESDIHPPATELSTGNLLVINEIQLIQALWNHGLRYIGEKAHTVTGCSEYPAIVSINDNGFSMESLKMLGIKAKELQDECTCVPKEVQYQISTDTPDQ